MNTNFAVVPSIAFSTNPFPGSALAANDGAHPDAEAFRRSVDMRLAATRALVDAGLAKNRLKAAIAVDVRQRFECAFVRVFDAAKDASTSGVVSRDDARDIRASAHALHAEMRHALRGNHAFRGPISIAR